VVLLVGLSQARGNLPRAWTGSFGIYWWVLTHKSDRTGSCFPLIGKTTAGLFFIQMVAWAIIKAKDLQSF
jgi:hypothetical protein